MKLESKGDLLRVTGLTELDATNATQVKDEVRGAVTPEHRQMEVDLSQVAFLDSSGLGALIALHKTMVAQHGEVRLLNPTPIARQVLELTRMHRVFEVTSH